MCILPFEALCFVQHFWINAIHVLLFCNMKYFVVLLFGVLLCCPVMGQDVSVLVVTGGYTFDESAFFEMFDQMEGIHYDHLEQPEANRVIFAGKADKYDVLVFYDRWERITPPQKLAYLQLTRKGKPFLFLHQSLASYPGWKSFEEIIGGRYVVPGRGVSEQDLSTSDSNVWVYCSVENYTPVTAGFSELRFFDEVYGNLRISEAVKPLLRTRHPQSAEFVAWENHYNASTIVYIQPGADQRTFTNPDYRKLLQQAIRYLKHTTPK